MHGPLRQQPILFGHPRRVLHIYDRQLQGRLDAHGSARAHQFQIVRSTLPKLYHASSSKITGDTQ